MKKIFFALLLFPLFFGCAQKFDERAFKQLDEVKDFFSEHPKAEIDAKLFRKQDIPLLEITISRHCGRKLPEKAYWLAEAFDADSGRRLFAWIDTKTKKADCLFIPPDCKKNSDCDDGNTLTIDACVEGSCIFQQIRASTT